MDEAQKCPDDHGAQCALELIARAVQSDASNQQKIQDVQLALELYARSR